MVKFEVEMHQMAPAFIEQERKVIDKVLNSISEQIEAWLKLEFQAQPQFSAINWSDRELVTQTLYDNGYHIGLSGMGEYILYQNHQEKSRFTIQMNFSR